MKGFLQQVTFTGYPGPDIIQKGHRFVYTIKSICSFFDRMLRLIFGTDGMILCHRRLSVCVTRSNFRSQDRSFYSVANLTTSNHIFRPPPRDCDIPKPTQDEHRIKSESLATACPIWHVHCLFRQLLFHCQYYLPALLFSE